MLKLIKSYAKLKFDYRAIFSALISAERLVGKDFIKLLNVNIEFFLQLRNMLN